MERTVNEPTAVKSPGRPFSTAVADSSAPGTGTAPRSRGSTGHRHRHWHRVPGTAPGTGHRHPHRIGAPGAPMGTGSLNRHGSFRGSNGCRRREPAQASALAPAPRRGSRGSSRHQHRHWHRHRHRAPGTEPRPQREVAPGTGTSPGHRAGSQPASRGRHRGTRPWLPPPRFLPEATGTAARCQARAPSSELPLPGDRSGVSAGGPSRAAAPDPGAFIGEGGTPPPRSRGGHPWGRAALYQRRRPAGRAFGRREPRWHRRGVGRGSVRCSRCPRGGRKAAKAAESTLNIY